LPLDEDARIEGFESSLDAIDAPHPHSLNRRQSPEIPVGSAKSPPDGLPIVERLPQVTIELDQHS
jgi:hypothetical protein